MVLETKAAHAQFHVLKLASNSAWANPISAMSAGRPDDPNRPGYDFPQEPSDEADDLRRRARALIVGSISMSAAQQTACALRAGSTSSGIGSPEDLILVPNTRWILASGMVPGSGLHPSIRRARRRGASIEWARRTPGPIEPGTPVPRAAIRRSPCSTVSAFVLRRQAVTRCTRPTMAGVNRLRSSRSTLAAPRRRQPGRVAC